MKEMTEVEQNIWREENNGVDKRGGRVRTGNIPEGWWRSVTDPECKEVEKMSQEKRSNNLLVETHWTRLRTSRDLIENKEEWKCSTWLERTSQEHLRRLEWTRREEPATRTPRTPECNEMKRKMKNRRLAKEAVELRSECNMKAGNVETGRLETDEKLEDIITTRARKFWFGKSAEMKDREMKDTDAQDDSIQREEENIHIHEGRKKKTSQVEDRKLTVEETQTKNQYDEEDTRNFMFRKPVRFVSEDDKEVTSQEEMQKDELCDQTRKMYQGTRRSLMRKDAVRGLAKMHYQERSPVGKVVKQNRGTPRKVWQVHGLKKVFENGILGAA